MLDFRSVLLSSEKQKELTDFYKQVFNKKPEMEDENYSGFMVGTGFISIGFHDKVKGENKNPERIILNFETKEVKEEFERIKTIGATVIKAPYEMGDMWIATLADPDGNYFQLMTPWEEK
jgi:predicted enzyme related to lactoylglutathione lyase